MLLEPRQLNYSSTHLLEMFVFLLPRAAYTCFSSPPPTCRALYKLSTAFLVITAAIVTLYLSIVLDLQISSRLLSLRGISVCHEYCNLLMPYLRAFVGAQLQSEPQLHLSPHGQLFFPHPLHGSVAQPQLLPHLQLLPQGQFILLQEEQGLVILIVVLVLCVLVVFVLLDPWCAAARLALQQGLESKPCLPHCDAARIVPVVGAGRVQACKRP